SVGPGAGLCRDERNGVDLDLRALEEARDPDSRAGRQVPAEALAANAAVLRVLIEAGEPRGDANDVLERTPDRSQRLLDLGEAAIALLAHRPAGRYHPRDVHGRSLATDRHRLAVARARRYRNSLRRHTLLLPEGRIRRRHHRAGSDHEHLPRVELVGD